MVAVNRMKPETQNNNDIKRIMKTKLMAAVALMATTLCLSAQSTNAYSLVPNAEIADGNPAGLTEQFGVSGISGGIGNVSLSLDIAGGFNGDLYAYLVGPQGQMAILLNRVGLSGSNPIGYGDAGMSITLDQSASNGDIHYYQNVINPNGGQLTGTWGPDGRNIDPQSSGTVFDGAATTSGLNLFQGTDPNGMWTFFIADLSSGGGVAMLNNVTLTIMTVPEPQTWMVLGGGLATLLLALRRK